MDLTDLGDLKQIFNSGAIDDKEKEMDYLLTSMFQYYMFYLHKNTAYGTSDLIMVGSSEEQKEYFQTATLITFEDLQAMNNQEFNQNFNQLLNDYKNLVGTSRYNLYRITAIVKLNQQKIMQ